METIYIKLNIDKSDEETNFIREEGLFFERIAEAVNLSRDSIEEIDENSYLSELNNIKNKFAR